MLLDCHEPPQQPSPPYAEAVLDGSQLCMMLYKMLKPAATIFKSYYSHGIQGAPPAEIQKAALTVWFLLGVFDMP
jgi:hypothetical protein